MSRFNLENAHAAIINGVDNANRIFLTISGGSTIRDYGVEPLISSQVAIELWKRSNGKKDIFDLKNREAEFNVTLETSFREISEFSSSEKRGRKNLNFTDAQKADVVLWDSMRGPVGVVEIKRHFVFSNISNDLERITYLLEKHGKLKGGSMRWGAVAGMREVLPSRIKESEQIAYETCVECESAYKNFNFSAKHKLEMLPEPIEYNGGQVLDGLASFAIIIRPKLMN